MKRYTILTIDNLTKLQEQMLSYLPINTMVEESKANNARAISYLRNTSDILDNVPLLKQYLNNFNLTHNNIVIGINVAQPYYKSPIHLDPLDFAYYSINIPICNCDNTFLHFYKATVNNKVENLGGNSRHKINATRYSPQDCIHLETLNTDKPYILNMTTPHQFDNSKNDKPRYMLLCRVLRNYDSDVGNLLK